MELVRGEVRKPTPQTKNISAVSHLPASHTTQQFERSGSVMNECGIEGLLIWQQKRSRCQHPTTRKDRQLPMPAAYTGQTENTGIILGRILPLLLLK
jgi:hypothetical protein